LQTQLRAGHYSIDGLEQNTAGGIDSLEQDTSGSRHSLEQALHY